MSDYQKAWIGVDPVIFTIDNGALKVLLHTREKEPFIGKNELPGGLMLSKETAKQTLVRKLNEVVGVDAYFKQFHTFTNLNRDPRERAISIGYIALISKDKVKDDGFWYDYNKLPDMAFDHKEIIKRGKLYLKRNIRADLVKQFLPVKFPLNKLQEVYEVIEGIKYDNRNFRKKMISSGIVKETNELEKDVSHRPAKLFKFV